MSAIGDLSLRNSSNSVTTISTLAIFSYLIAVFLALVNLKFLPANIESPFETHGVIMSMFVITILVYVITFCTSYFSEIISNISILSGSFAPVLLAPILFPRLGRFILLTWVIYFVKLIYDACQKLYQLCNEISSVSDLSNQLLGHPGHLPYFTSSERTTAGTAINQRHAILSFPIAALLAFMPLKFHSMNITAPFETHRVVMSIFVITTIVYAVAWAIEVKLGTGNNSYQHVIITKIILLSGSLAIVLLVLVIIQPLGWFLLLVWTLFLVKLIYHACQKLRQLHHAILSAFDVFN